MTKLKDIFNRSVDIGMLTGPMDDYDFLQQFIPASPYDDYQQGEVVVIRPNAAPIDLAQPSVLVLTPNIAKVISTLEYLDMMMFIKESINEQDYD
jgi:hypothetical protein